MQQWRSDNVWIGGGLGLSVAAVSDNVEGDSNDTHTGFGIDLRAGYNFITTNENTGEVSIEINPGFYSDNGGSVTLTGVGFLLGYQHL